MTTNVSVFEPAIRALSDSTPTPLQEQNANSGKEETASFACGNNVDESP